MINVIFYYSGNQILHIYDIYLSYIILRVILFLHLDQSSNLNKHQLPDRTRVGSVTPFIFFIYINLDDYGLQLMKTQKSVTQKI